MAEGGSPDRGRDGGEAARGAVCQLVVEDLAGATVRLTGAEAKHLARSLRAGPGEHWWATDGRGTRARLEILQVGRASVDARVLERTEVEIPLRRWWLATAAAETRLDWLVEKATEMGAWGMIPLRRSSLPLRRTERWGRLARAALGQCLGAWELRIAPPATVPELLQRGAPEGAAWSGVCIADPDGTPGGAMRVPLPPGDILLLAGPPEGFALQDNELLAGTAGALRVRLGGLRLRSETAGLALLVWARLRDDLT